MADKTKSLRVTCRAAELIDIDELQEFQGELKILSEDDYQKLRASILKYGISFPFFVWKQSAKKLWILDAHQRKTTLMRMRDEEQFKIPKVPIAFIDALNEIEAAEKLLALNSQFGEITQNSFANFVKIKGLNFDTVASQFQVRSIDLVELRRVHFTPATEVSFKAGSGSKELNESDFENFDYQCPKCKFSFND